MDWRVRIIEAIKIHPENKIAGNIKRKRNANSIF